jgi:hypothetical protein
MINNLERLKLCINDNLETLCGKLEKELRNHNPGTLRSGAWIDEDKNTILGFISINPFGDPEEETIDIGLQVEIADYLCLTIDVCWSDGELVKNITKKTIPNNLTSQNFSELKNSLIEVSPEIIKIVTQQLDEYLSPKFRRDR